MRKQKRLKLFDSSIDSYFIRVVIHLRALPKIVINKKNNKVIYKSAVLAKVSWPQKAWD